MLVKDLIEGALYLSIYDRQFNALSENQTEKNEEIKKFIPVLNQILFGIAKKNPSFDFKHVSSSLVKEDQNLKISYIDLEENFSTILRVEYLHSGGSLGMPLQRAGINDFFSSACIRSVKSLPELYNYNVYSKRLYIYPNPTGIEGYNIFGKKRIGPFTEAEVIGGAAFPEFSSESFLLYAEYYLAKFICSQYNVPWQAQKEDLMKAYAKMVDSENNNPYQEMATQNSGMPLRILWNSVRFS